jgi:hypothetical protein
MIKTNIGPTDIYICESTANCVVYNPTETYAREIAEYIYENNYTCEMIYHENKDKALMLQRLIGGLATTDLTQAESYEKTLC